MQQKFLNITYRLLITLIVIYVLLRAYFVSPLFDESASYFFYFMFGHIWDERTIFDANNHLLTSYVANFWYRNGFDHFFFFRLLSVVGFIAYVLAWHRIVFRYLNVKWKHFLVLCAISVPWIIEYGALARGYAISLGAFMWMLILFIEINRKATVLKFIVFYCLAWISVFSSTPITIPVFLLIGVLGIHQLLNIKRSSLREKLAYIGLTILFVIAYLPLYRHSIKLKEAGLLWWGSREGLWEVSGVSISKVVLFSESNLIQWLLYIIIFASLLVLVVRLYRTKIVLWFENPFNWIVAYTLGLLACLIIFSVVLKMNYPMDRVGMYLVPLFILLIIHLFSVVNWTKFGLLILLFFPVSLILHMNLNTTLFSPTDTIPDDLYERITQTIPKDAQVGTDWMGLLMFNEVARRKGNELILVEQVGEFPLNTHYLLLSYQNRGILPAGYRLLMFDDQRLVAVYKKIEQKKIKTLVISVKDQVIPEILKEFVVIPDQQKWTSRPFSYSLKGDFMISKPTENLTLHVVYLDSAGKEHLLQHCPLHFYYHPKTAFHSIIYSNTFPAVHAKEIHFYFENAEGVIIRTKNMKLLITQEED